MKKYKVLRPFNDLVLGKNVESGIVEYEENRANEINSTIKMSNGYPVLELSKEENPKPKQSRKKKVVADD